MKRLILLLVAAVGLASFAEPASACPKNPCDRWGRAEGDVVDLGEVPEPGLPESVKCDPFHCYVSGPATHAYFGDAAIFRFNRWSSDREMELAFEVSPAVPQAPNGLAGLAVREWYLYAVQVNGPVEKIVKIDLRPWNYGHQTDYSGVIPDLPPCPPGEAGENCTISFPCEVFAEFGMPCDPVYGRPPLANSMVFGPDGSLFLSDSFQATIWRIPPGGGAPERWLHDARLEAPYGVNGMAYNDGWLYATVTGPFGFAGQLNGTIYRIPVDEEGEGLEIFWEFNGGFPFGPDEMAFSPGGNLYVTGSLSNLIAKISPEGLTLRIYQDARFQNPAGIFFEPWRCSFYTVNHALLYTDHYTYEGPLPPVVPFADFALFEVFTGEAF